MFKLALIARWRVLKWNLSPKIKRVLYRKDQFYIYNTRRWNSQTFTISRRNTNYNYKITYTTINSWEIFKKRVFRKRNDSIEHK